MPLSTQPATGWPTGQQQAALDPIQEAASIRGRLAENDPDAYLPDLARSLYNLSNRLADTGQQQAALDPIQEAASIRGRLAETAPTPTSPI